MLWEGVEKHLKGEKTISSNTQLKLEYDSSMPRRLKVLVSAYACNPSKGSEPGVGWGFVLALARTHDLYVITEAGEQDAIERYRETKGGLENVVFRYIPRKRNKVMEMLWPPAYYWTYRRWQKDALAVARELHSEVDFDLAHQLTMVGFREPGYLWKLGVPFVWGPVGGMGLFPWRFLRSVGGYGAIYYLAYNVLNFWQMHFSGRPKLAAKIAGRGLIAINTENQRGILNSYSVQSEVCIPVGPPPRISDQTRDRKLDEPLRIIWVGLHNPGKALNIGLHALSMVSKNINWELSILGAGRSTEGWKKFAAKLDILERCRFYGQVSREVVLQRMADSHIHLFTSLREGTPSVVVEASALGVPTICLDLSGMSDMVINEVTGFKIKPADRRLVIKRMAELIELIAHNEPLRKNLGNNARESIKDLSWEKKAETIEKIYQSVLYQQSTRPT